MFAELVPQAEVRHIVDDSLLPEVLRHGGVTPNVQRRMLSYYQAAADSGANLIFNQCSSVGEVADQAAATLGVPVVKIDRRMAETACLTGSTVGVIATLETTLGPTCRLLEATAKQLKRQITLRPHLVAGAFDKLVAGDRAEHNRLVLAAIRELSATVDVIVCAQGSMIAVVAELGATPVPVLTSPRLGVEHAAEVLRARPPA
ncbi:MAG: aspartate/glutamate racemase family protein [Lacunisphaera sp.]